MTKKKRGRPAPPKGIDVYTGCGRIARYRMGQRVPCECQSCKAQ